MIFYFTATGNSLFAASQIAKATGDAQLISIPQAIQQEGLEYTADHIGIVCPIFGHEMPPMVKDFLKKAAFHTDYFYIVETYGKRNGGCAELAANFCTQCGLRPAYINIVLMVDNFLPAFDMDEERRLDKKVDAQLAPIIADIKASRHFIRPSSDEDRAAHKEFLAMAGKMPQSTPASVYTITDACTGCGTCAKVCPTGCFHVENSRASHSMTSANGGHCQMCMACIHACPQKAITLKMPEKNPSARYRNPAISLAEIIAANNQNKRNDK